MNGRNYFKNTLYGNTSIFEFIYLFFDISFSDFMRKLTIMRNNPGSNRAFNKKFGVVSTLFPDETHKSEIHNIENYRRIEFGANRQPAR